MTTPCQGYLRTVGRVKGIENRLREIFPEMVQNPDPQENFTVLDDQNETIWNILHHFSNSPFGPGEIGYFTEIQKEISFGDFDYINYRKYYNTHVCSDSGYCNVHSTPRFNLIGHYCNFISWQKLQNTKQSTPGEFETVKCHAGFCRTRL